MSVLYIGKEIKLSIKNKHFLVKHKNKEIIIPANEIKTILIDSFFSITKEFFSICEENNITLIMTNNQHYPNIMLINLNSPYFKMYENLQYQINFDKNEKLKILAWKKILIIKLLSYMNLTKKLNFQIFRKIKNSNSKLELLQIEGEFANSFFKEIYGENFKRKSKYFVEKDVINSFLNYGYSLLRSKIIHYLTINGLLPYFSIFHSPKNNNFALADDLIECYRFVIDSLVLKNLKEFQYIDILNTDLKKLALSAFSLKVNIKNKGNFILNDAIDLAIKDYKQFLITKDLKYLNAFKIKLF